MFKNLKEYQNYKINPFKLIDIWIALDDKDRIISFDNDKKKVLDDCIDFQRIKKNFGVKLYKTYPLELKDLIMGILNPNQNNL